MVAQIRINADGLSAASSNLKKEGSEFESLLARVEQIIASLPNEWEGEAASAYAVQFENLKPGLSAARELFQDIAVQIDETITEMAETDETLASRIG